MACGYNALNPTLGGTDYVTKFTAMVAALDISCAEIEAARNGQTSLLLSIQSRVPYSGWTQNVNANNFTINNLPIATSPSQPPTLSQVQALILGGGNPNDIAITDLNKGTATEGQYIGVVSGEIAGITPPTTNKAELMFFS